MKKPQNGNSNKNSHLFQDLILCSLSLTSSPLMCMKIPLTMKHFFAGNYLNFYYTGIPFPVRRGLGELSLAHGISSSSQQISQCMISQNVHFLCTKFQNGTTSLQISYSLEGGCTWFLPPSQWEQWLDLLQALRKQRLTQKRKLLL